MNFKRILVGLIGLWSITNSVLAEIKPGQGINITISGVPTEDKAHFDAMYPVSESGMINMPFIGPVRAAGLRPEQLAAVLEARYKAGGYYTHPTIQVIDNTIGGKIDEQQVVIGGQVRKNGAVLWTRGLTLYQAIQNAGGPTEFGSMKRVKLLRAGKQKVYDLSKLEYMQIPLEPGDTIEVPDKNWRGG